MEAPLHQSPLPMPPPPQPVPAMSPAMAWTGGGGGREQCPRCASRDTKFCYYNNYNTAQPRHFCRACRRYWTLGGSLRNVPIGGSTRKRPRPHHPHRRAAALAINANASAPPQQQQQEAAAAPPPPSLLWSALLGGAAPVLEGRLGMDEQIGGSGGFGTAGQVMMWPGRVMEGETWKGGMVAGGGVYSSPAAVAALWQELAAGVAPVELAATGGGVPQLM